MAVSCKLSKYSIHPSDESDGFFGQGLFNNINHSLNVMKNKAGQIAFIDVFNITAVFFRQDYISDSGAFGRQDLFLNTSVREALFL